MFNAASSELRNEVTLRSRNEFASLHTVTSTIHREVDALGTQINEDVSNLKHEWVLRFFWWITGYSPRTFRIQMELGNRKNEAKNELKRQDIVIEVNHPSTPLYAGLKKLQSMYNRTMGSLGDLKTEVEEAKWDNMRKSVGKLSAAHLIYAVL